MNKLIETRNWQTITLCPNFQLFENLGRELDYSKDLTLRGLVFETYRFG